MVIRKIIFFYVEFSFHVSAKMDEPSNVLIKPTSDFFHLQEVQPVVIALNPFEAFVKLS